MLLPLAQERGGRDYFRPMLTRGNRRLGGSGHGV